MRAFRVCVFARNTFLLKIAFYFASEFIDLKFDAFQEQILLSSAHTFLLWQKINANEMKFVVFAVVNCVVHVSIA